MELHTRESVFSLFAFIFTLIFAFAFVLIFTFIFAFIFTFTKDDN